MNMKYLFILGRNIELSIAEIFAYFEREENKILRYSVEKNSILIDFQREINKGIINDFGGVISIGKVFCSVDSKELEKQKIYTGTKNKINYVVWNFSETNSYNTMSYYLKKFFKEQRVKAVEKNLNGSLELQDGTRLRIASGLIDEEYFVYENYFGKIIEKCDYKNLELKDMQKPVRRESLSISPRLAKIMINLSKAGKNESLLDPFCGIGVILVEALNKKINVVGVDKDESAIHGAMKNLNWFKFAKEDYNLIRGDSMKISVGKFNVIVTEPDLGVVLKKIPNKKQASLMIRDFEDLIISVIRNTKNSVYGRIVFSSPLINVGRERISCNAENIVSATGLKIANGFPIKEYRKDQIVGREIIVLER